MALNEENNEQLNEQNATPNNEVVVEVVENATANATEEQAEALNEEQAESDNESTKGEKESIEDVLRKLADVGMSLLGIAKSKAEKAVNSFVEKSKVKMSPDNRKELVDDIFEETEKARENIETRLREASEKIKARFDFATQKDVKKLKKRVKKLEKLLKEKKKTADSKSDEE